MTELTGWTVTPRKHTHVFIDTGPCSCGASLADVVERARRGKNNRSRGNAIERYVCRLLGIRRVGQFGGLADGGEYADHLVIQVKSGGAFQTALLSKIHTIPVRSDQLRAWVTVETPGSDSGRRRSGVISFDLHEFADWYGRGLPPEEEPA